MSPLFQTLTGSLAKQLAHLSREAGRGSAVCAAIEDDIRADIQHQIERLDRAKSKSQASSSKHAREAGTGNLG